MTPATAKPKTRKSTPGSKPDAKDDLKSLPIAEVEEKLGSSPDGLTQAEAEKRLTRYGPNEIEEKKTNEFLKFLKYFWGPIPWMIEMAVVLSGVVQHWPDFFIILVLLFANAMIGFWEEHQAGNAIDALKAGLAIKARVKRDGKWVTPPARELVPGDAILGTVVFNHSNAVDTHQNARFIRDADSKRRRTLETPQSEMRTIKQLFAHGRRLGRPARVRPGEQDPASDQRNPAPFRLAERAVGRSLDRCDPSHRAET